MPRFNPGWWAVCAFVMCVPAASSKPGVTLELVTPETAKPGQKQPLVLKYAVTGESLTDVLLTLELPEYVVVADEVVPQELTRFCQLAPGNPFDWTCTYSAAELVVPSGGLSGQVGVTLHYAPGALPPGAVLPVTASFDASYSEGGATTAIDTVSTTANVTVSPAPNDLKGHAILSVRPTFRSPRPVSRRWTVRPGRWSRWTTSSPIWATATCTRDRPPRSRCRPARSTWAPSWGRTPACFRIPRPGARHS